jgi:endo-1,4-beta-xylanase
VSKHFLHSLVATVAVVTVNCSSGGTLTPSSGGSGGTDGLPTGGSGVSPSTGGDNTSSLGGSGADPTGGAQALGGTGPTGGAGPTGGKAATGGAPAAGGGGAAARGSSGAATGGKAATGGLGGGSGTTGAAGANNAGAAGVDCTTTMPTGGATHTGSNVNGTADGLNYGIWSSGSGGDITVFTNARAFAASWDNSSDFLAHLGLDFNASKSYTAYGTIAAQFVESKMGTSGGWSSIGIYGWMHSPCVEWYINEDSFNGLAPRGSVTATIDGATYYLTTSTTTGTGGANACEAGHTGGWTNMTSTRATPRQCGTTTVSDHFAAWAQQGWSLGSLASVHINVEVGGGTGSIQFPVANVTTTSN